jgi:hypothetical protein
MNDHRGAPLKNPASLKEPAAEAAGVGRRKTGRLMMHPRELPLAAIARNNPTSTRSHDEMTLIRSFADSASV